MSTEVEIDYDTARAMVAVGAEVWVHNRTLGKEYETTLAPVHINAWRVWGTDTEALIFYLKTA